MVANANPKGCNQHSGKECTGVESKQEVWYHGSRKNWEDIGSRGQAFGGIHLGTFRAAQERLNNSPSGFVGGKPGAEKVHTVRFTPKNPFNTPDNPLSEHDMTILLSLKDTEHNGMKWNDIAKNHDAVYYRNGVEDKGSTSVVALDKNAIEHIAVQPHRYEEVLDDPAEDTAKPQELSVKFDADKVKVVRDPDRGALMGLLEKAPVLRGAIKRGHVYTWPSDLDSGISHKKMGDKLGLGEVNWENKFIVTLGNRNPIVQRYSPEAKDIQDWARSRGMVCNVFCATGVGGGVDTTCHPMAGEKSQSAEVDSLDNLGFLQESPPWSGGKPEVLTLQMDERQAHHLGLRNLPEGYGHEVWKNPDAAILASQFRTFHSQLRQIKESGEEGSLGFPDEDGIKGVVIGSDVYTFSTIDDFGVSVSHADVAEALTGSERDIGSMNRFRVKMYNGNMSVRAYNGKEDAPKALKQWASKLRMVVNYLKPALVTRTTLRAMIATNAGTSEGAKRGWDNRGRGRKAATKLAESKAPTPKLDEEGPIALGDPKSKNAKVIAAINDWLKNDPGAYHIDGPFFSHFHTDKLAVGLEMKPFEGALSLAYIGTHDEARGKGLASKTLKSITDLADKHGIPIEATVKPLDRDGQKGLSVKQLHAWYARHGFVREKYDNGTPSDDIRREPKKPLTNENPKGCNQYTGKGCAESNGKVAGQIHTAEFKNWFGPWDTNPGQASKVVDSAGKPQRVFHGMQRTDRLEGKFIKGRATSGPMPFFTDDPQIASGYAEGKQDTSLEGPASYNEWFKMKIPGFKKPVDLNRAWYHLPAERQRQIAAIAPRLAQNDDGDVELQGPEHNRGIGNYDQALKEHRGNVLETLVDGWLDSGALFNQEERFLDVLQRVGLSEAEYHNPNRTSPGVVPAYLNIRNPLDTTDIPKDVQDALQGTGKLKRGKEHPRGSDQWSKDSWSGKDWLERLNEDQKNNTTYAWTSIPDWVTKTLQGFGYDGIKDKGGKYHPDQHTVWVPFEPTQIKSAMGNKGTFNPKDARINNENPKGCNQFTGPKCAETVHKAASSLVYKGVSDKEMDGIRYSDYISPDDEAGTVHWTRSKTEAVREAISRQKQQDEKWRKENNVPEDPYGRDMSAHVISIDQSKGGMVEEGGKFKVKGPLHLGNASEVATYRFGKYHDEQQAPTHPYRTQILPDGGHARPEGQRVMVADDPSLYGKTPGELNHIWTPGGAPVRGSPISPDDPRIPDEVYHVTSNLSAIKQSGYLRAGGAGGLGGDRRDQIVSMTIDKGIADRIAKDMKFVAELVKKHGLGNTEKLADGKYSDNTEWGKKVVKDLNKRNKAEGWAEYNPDPLELKECEMNDWMIRYHNERKDKATGKRILNPLFMDVEEMNKIDPANIGVIRIPKKNLKTGAMLTDFDMSDTYGGLKEIRMYGDVPLGKNFKHYTTNSELAR